jgi:predicted DNA binding CopG/RHH family protein
MILDSLIASNQRDGIFARDVECELRTWKTEAMFCQPGIAVGGNGRCMMSQSKKRKKIPRYKSEDRKREFWAAADSTEYVDWSRARRVILPRLKPSLKTISLRLPELMLAELKMLASKRDVHYQSLIKVFLAERLKRELRS